jgi:hypothetical protein
MTDGGFFSILMSGQFATTAALVLIVVASRMILRSYILALLVALPIAVLVPWRMPGGQSVSAFTLAACAVWLAWLFVERAESPKALIAMAAVATIAAFISAQSLLVTAAAAVALAVRPPGGASRLQAAAVVLVPLAIASLVSVAMEPQVWAPSAWPSSLAGVFTDAWSADNWWTAAQGRNFLDMQAKFSRWFYWPMLLPIALLLYSSRGNWWLRPTVVWAATLAGGAFILGPSADLFDSPPLQAALIVPGSLAGLVQILEIRRLRRVASPNGLTVKPDRSSR